MNAKRTPKHPPQSFQSEAATPFFWWLMASDLFEAAEALLEVHQVAKAAYFGPLQEKSGWVQLTAAQQTAELRLRFPRVYLLLVGLAFENALKGLLIARNSGLIADGIVDPSITKHSLRELFRLAAIPIPPQDGTFLDRVSESVTWASRYPVCQRRRRTSSTGKLNPATTSLQEPSWTATTTLLAG